MKENTIIGALIGLVGACNNNPRTENTDRLIIKALAFEQRVSGNDASTAEDIIDEIHAEKDVIAPGCSICQTPCGNTSDYDMSLVYNDGNETGKLKIDIISELKETAAYIHQKGISLSNEETEFFYKALSYIRYDLKREDLLGILNEAKEFKHKISEE